MGTVLLIRVSSLGDVVQTFPALSDLECHRPSVNIDWLVEEAYEPLVALHPAASNVIPFALRRWRRTLLQARSWQQASSFYRQIRLKAYDAVIDAQGLLKSLAIAKMARGPIHGFGPRTIREPFVSRFYDHTYEFPENQHRVWHYRGLMAAIFGYQIEQGIESIDYGLSAPPKPAVVNDGLYVVLLHSTAREEKLWPEAHWIRLGHALHERGITCVLPWGDVNEHARAKRLAEAVPGALLMPRLSLDEAAGLLARASCVVGVDTGLMHLAVAYKVPVVGIYLATRPEHHGPLGAGPTAFCGGMDQTPSVEDVLDAVGRLVPGLA